MVGMKADFVDAAVAGWAARLPSACTDALEITGRLERIARHLDRRTAATLVERGLTCRDLEVLGALCRSGCGLPAGRLARAAMLTSGGMTGEADRLAEAGLIVRKPDPNDRRAVLMCLTEQGRAVVEAAFADYLECSEIALTGLDETERATLAELLRKLLVGLEGPAATDEPAGEPRDVREPARSRFQA